MKRFLLAAATFAAIMPSAHAVDLELIQNIAFGSVLNDATNNPTQFIGTNASSLTWDGSTAFVGGGNGSGVVGNTAIARISNVLSTPTYSNAFGTLSVPNTRRVTSLVSNGGQVFASYDSGAASANPDSVRAFSATTLTQQWRIGDATAANDSTRRAYGVTIDPGFNGTGDSAGSVAVTSIGSGRRAALSPATGAFVTSGANTYGFGGGFIFAPASTTWRDLQFDTDGDVFAREQNRLIYANRTGDNSVTGAAYVGGITEVLNIDYQNLAIATAAPQGKYVFLNNRTNTAGGQTLASVLNAFRVNDSAGSVTSESIAFSFGSLAAPGTGVGAYDFSYASVNNTLAVTDFSNNRLYVFRVAAPVVVPEAGTVSLLAVGFATLGGVVLRRRKTA